MTNGALLKPEEKESASFYKRAVWWVEHRARLWKLGMIFLAACDAVLLLFAIWTFVDAFVVSVDREDRAVAEMAVLRQADLRAFSLSHAARPLEAKLVQVIATGDKQYDFYTTLSNPNADWYAEFRYVFVAGDQETQERAAFILPGEEKPIVSLAFSADNRPGSVRFDARDIVWRRVRAHDIPDYAAWQSDRFEFDITNISFSRDLQIDSKEIGLIHFTVQNRTAFSYWEPVFTVRLLRGGAVVGVTQTTLDQFEARETREVAINWFGTIPAVTKIEVIPEVNIFDVDAYMPIRTK